MIAHTVKMREARRGLIRRASICTFILCRDAISVRNHAMPLGLTSQVDKGRSMTVRKCVGIIFLCLFGSQVLAQSDTPKQEFLVVENPLDQSAWVYMTAKGGGIKDKRQQPFEIAPHTNGQVQFIGIQPYDITIVYGDGNYTQFDNANVCTWTKKLP